MMNSNKIFLNVRINFVTRCLILNEDEVRNAEFLVGKIFEEFEITSNQCINFKFRNNLMAPIEVMELPDLILQMKNSGSFYIELVLDEPPLTTRAEAIRNFIESSGHSNIFNELKVLGGKLSKKTEKALFDCLFSYIIKTFTNEVAQKDVAESCKATLLLFPHLETAPSDIGGIDELYNSKAKKGIIFHKLRNSRAATKKAIDLPDNEDTLSETDLKTLLKYCVVKNDKQKLKEALRKSVSMRRKLLAEDDPELMEFWKFYFVDIEMIRYDFHLLFENINDKSLEEKWDDLHKKPVLEFDKSIDFDKIPTVDPHIWQFVSIFHSLKPRGDFWKSLSSIIIFSKDPHAEPTSLLHNVNRNPYIIAISSADKKKNKFYIAVKGILISVPEECNIIHTLDLVYKIHKIFDMQPHCHIKRMMDFLEYFIYENLSAVNPGSISKQMHELGDGLLRITIE